jgi:hypothetical protein
MIFRTSTGHGIEPSPSAGKDRRLRYVVGIAAVAVGLIFIVLVATGAGFSGMYQFALAVNIIGLGFLVYLVVTTSDDIFVKLTTAAVTALVLIPSFIQAVAYSRGTAVRYPFQNITYSSPECFVNDGTLSLAGQEASQNVVQCRYTQDHDGKSFTYSFMPPQQLGEHDVTITGMDGTFGIDEDPANPYIPNATAILTVSYGNHTICRIAVRWGHPGHCDSSGDLQFVNNQPLVVSQVANFGAKYKGGQLFAGIIDPQLVRQ